MPCVASTAKHAEEVAKRVLTVQRAIDRERVLYRASVRDIRPHIVCCIIPGLPLGDSKVRRQFITIQTFLHDKHCGHRTIATIGSHDMAKAGHVGFIYQALDRDEIEFVALGMEDEMTAAELVQHYRESNPAMAQYVRIHACQHAFIAGSVWTHMHACGLACIRVGRQPN